MLEFEELAFDLISKSAPELIKNNGHFELVANEHKTRSDFSTIFFVANSSVYRQSYDRSIIIANVKKKGKLIYVSFSDRFQHLFDKACIEYSRIQSDSAVRLDALQLSAAYNNAAFSSIIESIVLSSFNFASFGCCSKFEKCSDSKKCLHDDYFYASAACQYKKHLEAGQIFYGKNANIK